MPAFKQRPDASKASAREALHHKRIARKMLLVGCDIVVIVLSHLLSLLLLHNLHITEITAKEWQALLTMLPVHGIWSLLVFWRLRL